MPTASALAGTLALLLLHPVAPPAAPPPAAPPELLAREWERHRANVVAYVEAMPREHLGFRPTEGVRSFAEQIEHIVTDHVSIVATVFGREDRPDLGDPDRYLRDRGALLAHVEAGYDWVVEVVRRSSPAELEAEGEVFGRYRVTRRRALEGALEHGTWTLGQVVPYLRLNGVTPPPYVVFPLETQVEGWEPPGSIRPPVGPGPGAGAQPTAGAGIEPRLEAGIGSGAGARPGPGVFRDGAWPGTRR
jgi:uncharacterized damage-inducible protein DinB